MSGLSPEYLSELINKGHIVGQTSANCRVCGELLMLTDHFMERLGDLVRNAYEGPIKERKARSQIVVCIACGWTWWVKP